MLLASVINAFRTLRFRNELRRVKPSVRATSLRPVLIRCSHIRKSGGVISVCQMRTGKEGC